MDRGREERIGADRGKGRRGGPVGSPTRAVGERGKKEKCCLRNRYDAMTIPVPVMTMEKVDAIAMPKIHIIIMIGRCKRY